nr:MAG TPA: hypothetical protein [Caudoviricetes sp.]
MTKTEFINNLANSWDSAIDDLSFKAMCDENKNIEALCGVYKTAYRTDDYQKTNDPDNGLCYKIREFAIDRIIENLED